MNDALQFLQEFIDRVLKLEPAKLLPLGSIAIGYALRNFSGFPNRWIPQACFLFLVCAYPAVSFQSGQNLAKYVIDFTIATILWVAAWIAYEKVLKPMEARFLGGDGNGDKKDKDGPGGPGPSAGANIHFWAMAAILLSLSLTGCARFTTGQSDSSTTQPDGTEIRTVTTRATAYTLFTSKSALANFKASQTDKSQGASVGALTQEASGSNAVNLVERIVGAAIKAAVP